MDQFSGTVFRILILTFIILSTSAKSDMSFGKAAMRQVIETPLTDVQKHYKETAMKRALTDNEKNVQTMLALANAMGVSKVVSYNSNFESFDSRVVVDSMIAHMHAHPKWDLPLPPQNLKVLNDYTDLLKKSFNEKSYAWAWLKKQNGETKVAKEILSELYKSGLATGMTQTNRGFGYSNPVSDLVYTQTALESMSSEAEKKEMDSKMQKLKTYYSNLPDSNIQT